MLAWYTNKQPKNDAQVAAHFASTRPVLGICLKRYGILQNGTAYKKRTHVDIPLEIGLPHFISDDDTSEAAPAFGNFKLSLQSFVCHEGRSVDSGHYISFTRTPDPTQQGQDSWLRLDDLAKERVIEVSMEERLKRESPYLLFYQVIPIEDTSTPPNGQASIYHEAPPSYAESNASRASQPRISSTEESSGGFSISEDGAPQRPSSHTSMSDDDKRGRSSVALEEQENAMGRSKSPAITSTPSIEIARAEGNATPSNVGQGAGSGSLNDKVVKDPPSRRGSSLSKSSNKSRPTSSSGDRKFSVGLSRLTQRMSGDKLSDLAEKAARDQTAATPHTIPEFENTELETKLKKPKREKSKLGLREHHLLMRAKKPDRECILM